MKPRLKTTVAGSYPMPGWLGTCPSRQSLLDAATVILKTLENAGIDLVSDGGVFQNYPKNAELSGTHDYYLRPLENIRTRLLRSELIHFHELEESESGSRPHGVVEGEIDEGNLNLFEDFRQTRTLTTHPLKYILPGPYRLCHGLLDLFYNSKRDLCMALAGILANQVADIDAEVVQVDESFPMNQSGEADWAQECINIVLDAVQTIPAVHLCFCDSETHPFSPESWANTIHFLNGLHAEHALLETSSRVGMKEEFLNDIHPDISIGLGVVDNRTTVVETPDEIAYRIDHVVDAIGEDRVAYVHPDCGLWMLSRTIADRKIRALVAGRDLFEGRQP